MRKTTSHSAPSCCKAQKVGEHKYISINSQLGTWSYRVISSPRDKTAGSLNSRIMWTLVNTNKAP